jgi:hypothetical protein
VAAAAISPPMHQVVAVLQTQLTVSSPKESSRHGCQTWFLNRRQDEETLDPLLADDRNLYKVEKWTKDGTKVDRMLYAGNNLDSVACD